MLQLQRVVTVETTGRGFTDITARVAEIVRRSRVDEGLLTLLVQHTSASLVVQENADPDVRHDLEAFLARLVPEDDPAYRHTAEGPDDMPAHIRSALTATSLSIPIDARRLTLGTWQAIYLWEHRTRAHRRKVVVHVIGDAS